MKFMYDNEFIRYNTNNIFLMFKENDNEQLSKMNKMDVDYFLYFLNNYYLEYRKRLNISNDITFGLEIELEHFKGSIYDFFPFEDDINSIIGNKNWDIKNDITLVHGRELATEIYTDTEKTWSDIEKVCNFSERKLEVGKKSAGHVNIGSHILGNDTLYWYRFIKLWGIYENIIYRFGYGEYLSYFPYMKDSSKPVGGVILNRLDLYKDYINRDTFRFIYDVFPRCGDHGFLKKNGISFCKMLGEYDYSNFKEDLVVEIRSPLSTLDYIIWQNYVNFFVHLMLYCKSDKFNEDILDRRKILVSDIAGDIDSYDNIYLEQALELADMIFDNNKDKIYFLKQYLKGFEVSSEKYKKAKKFTKKRDIY